MTAKIVELIKKFLKLRDLWYAFSCPKVTTPNQKLIKAANGQK